MQLEGYCPGGLTMGNQAYPNASAPASAIYFTHSKSKSNYALSWLPGKRLSSCSFPNSGQSNSSPSTRRAAPESKKSTLLVKSRLRLQSVLFTPFSH
ncbi:hypothetical protein F5887DRAFT_958024, partial [Amanita rubescens]